MNGVISIFLLPHEIDNTIHLLQQLKRNSIFKTGEINYKVDLSMYLDFVNWEESKLPREYFTDRIEEMVSIYLKDWCEWSITINDPEVRGCVSHRRKSHKTNPQADFFIWLDPNLVFSDYTLYYFEYTYLNLKEREDLLIITPENVRMWDSTWDVLCGDQYLQESYNHRLEADLIREALIHQTEERQIEEVQSFKFGGGWFTLLSRELLDIINIPESFGHYGEEDTFIMVCAGLLNREKKRRVSQYKIKNTLVNKLYKQSLGGHLKNYLVFKDFKNEFRKVSLDNFNSEVLRFKETLHKLDLANPPYIP